MYAKIFLMAATILLSGHVYAQDTANPDANAAVDSASTPATILKEKKKKAAALKAKKAAEAKKKKAEKTKEVAADQATTPAKATTPVAEVKKEEPKKEEAKKEEEPKTTLGKTKKYLKDHFTFSYHGEYYAVRRTDTYLGGGSGAAGGTSAAAGNIKDTHIQDVKVLHNPTIIYKPTPNWSFMATSEFKYTDATKDTSGTYYDDYYRSLFSVTRKNILEEKTSGVGLEAGIGRRDFNGGNHQPSKGNYRAFTTISKTFGKHSANIFLQYLYNDIAKSSAAQWKHSLEVNPTINLQLTEKLSYLFNDDIVINSPKFSKRQHDLSFSHEMNVGYLNYQWTDKINTYYQLKYYHTDGFDQPIDGSHLNADYMEHYVGIGYAFTPKATVTFEIGNEIIRSGDHKDFFGDKAQYPELAMYWDFAL